MLIGTPEFLDIGPEEYEFENNRGANIVYKTWDSEKRLEFSRDLNSWSTSPTLHGEQGALLVASRVGPSCASSI